MDPERDIAEHGPCGIGAWVMDHMHAAEFRRINAGRQHPGRGILYRGGNARLKSLSAQPW